MINVVASNNDLVVQEVTKADGTFIRYQYGKVGEGMAKAETLDDARFAIGLDRTIRVVDRKDDLIIRKVTSKNGKVLEYQYGKVGSMSFCSVPTLADARTAIGKVLVSA